MSGVPATAIVVLAKAPLSGLAKTRLIPALGAEGAAALAGRLLDHAVATAVSAGLGPVWLCGTPTLSHPAFQRLAALHGVVLSAQAEGDLGQRMQQALQQALDSGGPALLIGTDAPALDAARLVQAARALQDHDAVFVPALDGGYALVGLRAAAPALFSGMAWSTPRVMADTRERARAAGLRWAELPAVPDIDEPADLAQLPPGWLPAAPR